MFKPRKRWEQNCGSLSFSEQMLVCHPHARGLLLEGLQAVHTGENKISCLARKKQHVGRNCQEKLG